MGMTSFDVEFTKDGAVFDAAQVDALIAGLAPFTDLLVLSHGWNNDKADASQLYDELLGNIDKLLALRDQPVGARDAARVHRSPARAHFRGGANLLAQQEVHRCGPDSWRWRGNGAGRAGELRGRREGAGWPQRGPAATWRSHAGAGSSQSDGARQGAAADSWRPSPLRRNS